ncbi:hypothetical protein PHJA_001607600 [Phtheirospermum japonicum]|uniref:F-box associated beta-propeller type 3 domain-containing protein n=1 Tax=Phtheirospermum japonicum TaxID=374723 RepID=A0A830C8W7_9LAMI|nr:hypothetical protein PHJA_001607600 [Phtheirospermum japonicum]
MIHTHKFVNTHLHRSTYGLLIQNIVPPTVRLTFMALSRQGRIELTRLNYEPRYKIWCSSCNGLILESERKNLYALYITNPATMQHFALPPFFFPSTTAFTHSAIAYASLSMEYKVVRVYYQEEQWCCAIVTAGVDESWRRVCTQHLSFEAKELLRLKPLTTEGFVHWAKWGNYVLTLNVETEIITEYLVISLCYGDRFGDNYYYFSTVKYLSLLIRRRGWLWEVWEMKPETGEWTKLSGIEFTDRKCEILGLLCERDTIFKPVGNSESSIIPVGWLEYKEVFVYCFFSPLSYKESRICVAWNVRLKEYELIELDSNRNEYFVHRNSLLWLDGAFSAL